MARFLKMSLASFTLKYCEKKKGIYHLKEDGVNPDCLFLENKRCGVYEARPIQCRTWPFWPEVMNAKTWKKEVMSFCPGVGKGPVVPKETIEKNLKEQADSEDSIPWIGAIGTTQLYQFSYEKAWPEIICYNLLKVATGNHEDLRHPAVQGRTRRQAGLRRPASPEELRRGAVAVQIPERDPARMNP